MHPVVRPQAPPKRERELLSLRGLVCPASVRAWQHVVYIGATGGLEILQALFCIRLSYLVRLNIQKIQKIRRRDRELSIFTEASFRVAICRRNSRLAVGARTAGIVKRHEGAMEDAGV